MVKSADTLVLSKGQMLHDLHRLKFGVVGEVIAQDASLEIDSQFSPTFEPISLDKNKHHQFQKLHLMA